MEKEPWRKSLLRYFLHGLAFSIIFLVLEFVWAIIFAILIEVGLIIGFIIGLILLFLIIGGLNSFLTDLIWSIPIKTGWKSLLGHGFILFIALILVHIPAIAVDFIVPNLATTIVLFIIYALIDGFVAKNVAAHWEEEEEKEIEERL